MRGLAIEKVGYAMENIFKVLRVDFMHRLTYRGAEAAGFEGAGFVVKV